MPTISLTKRNVDAAQPLPGPDGAPRRTLYFDPALPGFGLLVTPAGSKSFVAQYRAGRGRAAPTRRVTIGPFGTWTPEQARAEARRILGEAAHGRDPAKARAEKRRGGAAAGTALAAVVADWLKRDQAHNRSRGEVERLMRREVVPVLGNRPMAEIRKRELIALVEAIADRGAPILANRVLAHTKRLFKWAASRDLIETDPAAHVARPAPEVRRDRVLDDDELLAVWRAAEPLGAPFGAGVRLLAATGARREEIFAAGWAEVDEAAACLRLPASRNKVKEARVIPLSPLATAVLDGLPRAGRFVVSARGDKSFSNITHAKARLDTAIARQRAEARLGRRLRADEEPEAGDALPAWRLHDLRRTVATGLQRLGVRLEAIEAVLGHVSGSRAGIVGVYQRHRFEDEARAALAAWGAHLQRLLDGGASAAAEVMPLRRA
jgi:integrase